MRKFLCLMTLLGGMVSYGQQTVSLDSVQQLDQVVVDTKVKQVRKNSGKTITVIDSERLQQFEGKNVAQVLNEISGFEINGSQSNNGQNLGYFVRGGRNRQVLILVDGVAVNDASNIANDYDLRLVPVGSIEQIEVMKGASSVLYGSGAATAVISITTKQASKKKFGITTNTVVGTDRPTEDSQYGLKAITNSVNLGGTLEKFFYQAQVNHQFNDGLSAVAAPEGEALFMEDTFNRFNARVNLGLALNKNFKFSRFVAVDDVDADFDDFSFLDAENKSITNQWRTGGNLTWTFNKGKVVVNDQYSEIDREIESSFPSKFESKVYSFDAFVQYQVISEMNVVLGINGNLSEMNSFSIPFGATDFNQDIDQETANFNYFDPYLNVVYNSSFGFNLSAGARANIHSLYGSQFVYQVNPSYNFDLGTGNLKVLGSYSTAYITSSLFQIYDPSFGNEALQPEENATLEGGLEFTKGKVLRVSAIYFTRSEDNFVDFVTVDPENFIFQYQNITDTFEASGVEVEAEAKIYKGLSANANFTYTQADDRFALRIPETKGLLGLNYAFNCGANVFTSFQYVSDRDDSFFNPDTFESETVVLDSYSLVNLNANYPVSEKVNLFIALDNLLDTEFEELYRFQARGRNIRVGVSLKL